MVVWCCTASAPLQVEAVWTLSHQQFPCIECFQVDSSKGWMPLLWTPNRLSCCGTSGLQVEESAPDPINSFHVDSPPQLPRWAQDCGWSPQDDAELLLGVCWHGMGS